MTYTLRTIACASTLTLAAALSGCTDDVDDGRADLGGTDEIDTGDLDTEGESGESGTDEGTTDEGTTDEGTTDTEGETTGEEGTDTEGESTGTDTEGSTGEEGTEGESTGEEGTDTEGSTGGEECAAPVEYIDCDGTPGNLTDDPFNALGINCGDDPNSTIVAQNTSMNSMNAAAWQIVTAYGTASGSNYNDRLWAANDDEWENPSEELIPANTSTAVLAISTGVIAAPNGNGVVVEAPGSQDNNNDNGNLDNGGLPAPMSAQMGSNNGMGGDPFADCDGVNDCSDSLFNHWVVNGWNDPNDMLWMQMDLTVPEGTEGYVFDFAYFSSEFPDWYNTEFNDLLIVWSTSETYTGNVTFVNDAPLTITSLEDAGAFQYKANAPQLAGTGFEGHAGTGWLVARGSAAPQETFQLTFFIADMGDSSLATVALLDNFRWECLGCIPSEVDPCGLLPQ